MNSVENCNTVYEIFSAFNIYIYIVRCFWYKININFRVYTFEPEKLDSESAAILNAKYFF